MTARAGGGPFNVARGLARLGVPCGFAGAISNDAFGQTLLGLLEQDGVATDHVVATDRPTTLAVARLQDGAAQYTFYFAGTSAPEWHPEDAGVATDLPALHVGSLGLVLEPMAFAVEALVASAHADTLVMADLNCRPAAIADPAAYRARLARLLERIDVVKASTEDLDYLGVEAADLVRQGPACVLVTDGPDPVRVFTRRGMTEIDVPVVTIADTVGAGDAFGAGFLAWWHDHGRGRADLARDADIEQATRFAVRVSAVVCERTGADPPSRADLA